MLGRDLANILSSEERLLEGGSIPKLPSSDANSDSCISSFALTSSAWSAILRAALSWTCFSKRRIWLRSSRFSDRRRAQSFSSRRIFCDWSELIFAMSRFWRRNFLRTAHESQVSTRRGTVAVA